MRDHSEQLEFMEIDLSEDTETTSIRIPDRSSIENQTRQPHKSQGAVLSSEKRFVEEARRLAEVTGEETSPVPFMSYWPTYGVMNDAQLKWYLYWRTQVRQERYPDVDLSYLFVHVYELINGIGWLHPEDGYHQLKQLWLNYRERLPQLHVYMQEWMVDYVMVHDLQALLHDVMMLSDGYLPASLMDKELERVLQDNVAEVTLDMLKWYFDYDVTLNAFYRDGGKEWMERYVPKVMAVMDSYLQRTQQRGLLPELESKAEQTVKRTLFHKAVYDESIYGRFVTFTHVPLILEREFVRRLIGIYRCTENKLRELLGFRGRLRGKTLEPELASVIERYLERAFAMEQAEAVTAPVIQIDTAKLTSLQKDSEYVRKALSIEDSAHSESDNAESDLEENADENERHGMDEPLFQEQQGGSLSILDNGSQPSMSSDRWNEVLIWDEAAEAHVPEEWREFAERLDARHVRAIHALLGEHPDGDLMRLAEETGTMPALLLDEMNDIAMETIGDLLVDGDRIVADYIDVFEHVKR
ncbi:TerB N-terminal domain-containing protein [Paenibacillus polysaccharolyticus]|uniref:TerB N-terminal domain-containing protein n=1 Tax=Paenibacillus polysaccharolyticus TaxID=582692 RepID=UPI00300A4880